MNLYIDDKKASIEEVKTRLGIGANDVPFSHLSKEFQRTIEKRYDPATKRLIIPAGMAIQAKFNAIDKSGEGITIRYAVSTRQRPNSNHADLIYSPLTIPMVGLSLHTSAEQKVLFFFLYINPSNRQSPLNRGKSNPAFSYEFIDKAQIAKDEFKSEDLMYNALTKFKSLGEKQLRQLAKGYNFQLVDSLSIYEVQQHIRGVIKKNPEDFINDLDGNEIALRGIVKDAIDKGILTYTEISGMKSWNLNGQELVKTKPGENEVTTLSQIVSGDMENYFNQLDEGIESVDSKEVLKKPENAQFFNKFNPENGTDYKDLTKTDKAAASEGAKQYAKGEYLKSQDYQDKLERWALTDLTNPDLNFQTRKAIEKNAEAVQAKRDELIAAGRTDVPKVPELTT